MKIRWIAAFMFFGLLLGGAPVRAELEYNTNRYGGDIGHVYVNSPQACESKCRNNTRCVAFSWVRAGCQGKQPICWLKGSAPPPTPDNCTVSGLVKRGGGDNTANGCVCVSPDGRRYRHAWGQDGCPAPDSANADYRSCR